MESKRAFRLLGLDEIKKEYETWEGVISERESEGFLVAKDVDSQTAILWIPASNTYEYQESFAFKGNELGDSVENLWACLDEQILEPFRGELQEEQRRELRWKDIPKVDQSLIESLIDYLKTHYETENARGRRGMVREFICGKATELVKEIEEKSLELALIDRLSTRDDVSLGLLNSVNQAEAQKLAFLVFDENETVLGNIGSKAIPYYEENIDKSVKKTRVLIASILNRGIGTFADLRFYVENTSDHSRLKSLPVFGKNALEHFPSLIQQYPSRKEELEWYQNIYPECIVWEDAPDPRYSNDLHPFVFSKDGLQVCGINSRYETTGKRVDYEGDQFRGACIDVDYSNTIGIYSVFRHYLIREIDSGKVLKRIPQKHQFLERFLPDGAILTVDSQAVSIFDWKRETQKEIISWETDDGGRLRTALSPCHRFCLVGRDQTPPVKIYSIEGNELTGELDAKLVQHGYCFAGDGSCIYFAQKGIFNLASGEWTKVDVNPSWVEAIPGTAKFLLKIDRSCDLDPPFPGEPLLILDANPKSGNPSIVGELKSAGGTGSVSPECPDGCRYFLSQISSGRLLQMMSIDAVMAK